LKPRLYFAAPLFSSAERTFNVRTAETLGEVFCVFLPQVDGGLLQDLVAEGLSEVEARRVVFKRDFELSVAATFCWPCWMVALSMKASLSRLVWPSRLGSDA
jgi:hypothetical protein